MAEVMSAVRTINASAETVFGILADPNAHAAIDGTGWVRDALDGEPVTRAGQTFRIAMYHDNHPNKDYEMENRVRDFDPPRVISWEPGQRSAPGGGLEVGGWVWRYDLTPSGEDETQVTLSYDWSAVPQETRQNIGFPPFERSHLDNSLEHLADLVK